MLSSSLKTQTIRSAALCAVLLFSPLAFCAWDKPTAQNQALISVGVLLAAPVVDGVLRNAKTLTSIDGWKNLPAALKAHIVQSLFAEGIAAREEDENFLKHKMRVVGTYAKRNPVFLLALAAVIANAVDSLNTEFNRLKKEAQPEIAAKLQAATDALATTKQALTAAEHERDAATQRVSQLEQSVSDATVANSSATRALETRLAEAEQTLIERQITLERTQREQAAAVQKLEELNLKYSKCAQTAQGLSIQLQSVTEEHNNCEALIEVLQSRNTELAAALEKATEEAGAGAEAGVGAGATGNFNAAFGDALRTVATASRAAAAARNTTGTDQDEGNG